jgi:hypothetical protein
LHRTLKLLGLVLIILIMAACSYDLTPSPIVTPAPGEAGTNAPVATLSSSNVQQPGGSIKWGVQTKISGCVYVGDGKLPDPACTPGDLIKPLVTKADICTSGYSSSVRDVPQSVKDQVYAEYGITRHASGQYEVDHFVSLELGGSNDISNLFPEPASPKPGFHEKDKVENYLHDQVCSGAMTLQTAQIAIATNWLDVYDSMPNK